MKKVFCILLVILMLPTIALADADLAAMTTEQLIELRQAINQEIASRAGADAAQVIELDGLKISFDYAVIGKGRNDAPAIAVVLSVDNTSGVTKKVMSDIQCDILQNGTILETTYFDADGFVGPSVSDSYAAKIKPGAVGMKITYGGLLVAESGQIEIDLFWKSVPAFGSVDPYCGTFSFDLSDIQ